MSLVVREITDRMQWNDFLLSQPSGHLLQSYEWSELQCYLGGQSYRLGALELRPDPEDLLANFRKAWRRNIRQAESMGVIVREARNEADFDTYYDLLKLSSKREKFFIHERAYHKEMLNQFRAQGNAVIYLAEHEGEPVAFKM